MIRKTSVRVAHSDPDRREVESVWTIRTYEGDDEWWSEILDPHSHPHVKTDAYGFDTVAKFFGDSVEESVRAALGGLEALLRERGGRIEAVGETVSS